jgi:hypothetical protein
MAKTQGVRMQVVLDEDAYRLLGELTTPHRKGEYLSQLIRRAAAEQVSREPEGIQLLQSIEDRLERIEEKLDELDSPTGSAPETGSQE